MTVLPVCWVIAVEEYGQMVIYGPQYRSRESAEQDATLARARGQKAEVFEWHTASSETASAEASMMMVKTLDYAITLLEIESDGVKALQYLREAVHRYERNESFFSEEKRMFVEHKEALEVTKTLAKTLKLSEAIRRGHTMIGEDRGRYLRANKGCALGALWVGMGRSEEEWRGRIDHAAFPSFAVADILGCDKQLALQISSKHYCGMPRLQIADWLEAQGL